MSGALDQNLQDGPAPVSMQDVMSVVSKIDFFYSICLITETFSSLPHSVFRKLQFREDNDVLLLWMTELLSPQSPGSD